MNTKIKAALFSYIYTGIVSAILLAFDGGVKNPADFLWAFLLGFAGPLLHAINPLDEAFGFKLPRLRAMPQGTAAQTAVADAVAGAVTAEIASAANPALDHLAAVVEPVAAPVVDVVKPIIDAATKKQ